MKPTSVCMLDPAGAIKWSHLCESAQHIPDHPLFPLDPGRSCFRVILALLQAQEVPPTPRKALLEAGAAQRCLTLDCTLASLSSAEHSCLRLRPNHETTAPDWRGLAGLPSFRIAVRGCDLTSPARSQVGLLVLDAGC